MIRHDKGSLFREETRRARHDFLGWKNLLLGWSTWRDFGSFTARRFRSTRDSFRDAKHAFDPQEGLPETFDAAVVRHHLTPKHLSRMEAQLKHRAAWWLVATSLALLSFMYTPLSDHWLLHGLMAGSLTFFCLARTTSWYFRGCQVHDHELYSFKTWFHTNPLARNVTAVLAAIVLIVLTLLAGTAHAGTIPHDFTPDPNDPSVQALREVFGSLVDSVLHSGNPSQDPMNSVLGAMMGPFNSLVLTITVAFAGYATVRTLIDTAHSGEFMGRQKADVSGYIIGRILLGVGLLVPLASGFSLIQYGMMWWCLQGVGVANQINAKALDYAGQHQTNMITQPQVPSAESFVEGVLRAKTCMVAMNKQFKAVDEDTRIVMRKHTLTLRPAEQGFWARVWGQISFSAADAHLYQLTMPVFLGSKVAKDVGEYDQMRKQWEASHTYNAYRYSFDATGSDFTNPEGVCGTFSFSNAAEANMDTSHMTQSIVAAQAAAVNSILQSSALTQLAKTIVDGSSPDHDDFRFKVHGDIRELSDTYSKAIIQAVEQQGGITGMSDADWDRFVKTMKRTGWAYLPSYYNQLIRANDNVQMAINTVPTFTYARVTVFLSPPDLISYNDAMTRLDELLQTPGDLIMANAQKTGGINLGQSWFEDLKEHCVTKSNDVHSEQMAAVANNSGADTAFDHIKQCLSVIPRRWVFQITHSLMGGNLNHIVHIKHIGDTIIAAGEAVIAAQFLASLTTGNVVAQWTGFTSAIASLGGYLSSVVIALLVFGGIAAYYIPLIPYIYGTVAFVKWLMLAIESIIAGPVFAAAHAWPEGHEVAGRAGAGYMLLLGLILRPALTVMGFYLAIIVAQPVADLINVTYGNAVMGASAGSMMGLVSLVAYVAIYVIMMTTVMHTVFTLINWVPDNVLRWIGGSLQAYGVGDQESGEMKSNVYAAITGGSHLRPAPGKREPNSNNKNKRRVGNDPDRNGSEGGDGGNNGGSWTNKELR